MSPYQNAQQENPNTKQEILTRLGDVLVNGIRPGVPTKVAYPDALTKFLIMSVEAAHQAEDYAARNNYSIRFTSEDVQGLGPLHTSSQGRLAHLERRPLMFDHSFVMIAAARVSMWVRSANRAPPA